MTQQFDLDAWVDAYERSENNEPEVEVEDGDDQEV